MNHENILDIVIHTTKIQQNHSRTPIKKRFNLTPDLWIGHLPNNLSEKVFKACKPAGYNFDPVLLFGELYSFIREKPPGNDVLKWDEDKRLQFCVALSRIVHPTSISFKYSARIFTDSNGDLQRIVPAKVTGSGSAAYVIDKSLDYLTEEDGEKLKELLDAYEKEPLKDPIARAMWYNEYASRINEIDLRWTLVSIGLEVLIHTDKDKSTRQFVKRIPKLSKKVGAGNTSESEAKKMYESRCSLSHGQGLEGLNPQKKKLYKKMEDILRLTISKSILDKSFRIFISDYQKIRKHWPI